MRSVGLWINETVGPRAHIEWFVSRKNFWVAQIDLEWPELDEGINPLDSSESSTEHRPTPAAARVFSAHQIGVSTPWKKLKNLEEFDFAENNSPRLYLATAREVQNSVGVGDTALADEINLLTAGRAVIRMEVHSSRVKPFNLPRTDTVDGYAAVKWLKERIEEYRPLVDNDEEIAFILHAFLPAKAGVWAYADPGQPIAFVDALWGLPDGLQVLPHDAYQVDVRQKKVSAQKIRFKPRFLTETSDGTWKYVNVLRAKSRSSTLSDKDAIEIGVRTAAIAEKLQQRAQIMWFSGVEPQYSVGRNLPWFRARETVDPAPRQSAKFPSFRISRHRDLDSVPLTPVALLLDPEAELIRDDTFLDAVIAKALERRLPVEIQGSTLSHTYYRLFSAGVAVNPPKFGDYSRSRKRRVFVKLVRDKIPEQIKKGGEIVVEARLPKSDISFALLGKLIEEIREFQIAKNSPEAIEEMADIVEVLRAISTEFEIGWDDIEASRIRKRKMRGGFDERRVLLETSLSKPDLQEEQLREISLQDFEQPHTIGERGLLFPYSALFSKVAQGRLDLNEDTLEVSVRLAPQGIVVNVEQRRRSLSRETQLELF
jgi:predicted house-cleaning noncanonical NTP pyrophosphatase (MazG superfamily)